MPDKEEAPMRSSVRVLPGDKRKVPRGLPVPEPHNDVSLTVVRSETTAEPKQGRWPMIAGLGLGGVITLLWSGFLGWLVFRFAAWLLG